MVSALVAIIEPSRHMSHWMAVTVSCFYAAGPVGFVKKKYALRSERHASQSHNSQVFGCFVNKQFELNVLEEKELYTVT